MNQQLLPIPLSAQETEQWHRHSIAEIEKTNTVPELINLRDTVVQNVTNAQATEFRKLCGTRAAALLKGEVAGAKTVKQVSDLRSKYTAILGATTGEWFNRLCDDRQREILNDTRKAKERDSSG
jgi:hypothetical protein